MLIRCLLCYSLEVINHCRHKFNLKFLQNVSSVAKGLSVDTCLACSSVWPKIFSCFFYVCGQRVTLPVLASFIPGASRSRWMNI